MPRSTCAEWLIPFLMIAGCGGSPTDQSAEVPPSTAEEETISATVVVLNSDKPIIRTQYFTREEYDRMIARRRLLTQPQLAQSGSANISNLAPVGSTQSALTVQGDCNDDNTLWLRTGFDDTGSLLCLIGATENGVFFDLTSVPGFSLNVHFIWPGLTEGGTIWSIPTVCGGECPGLGFTANSGPQNTPDCIGRGRYVGLVDGTGPQLCSPH